MLTTIKSLFSAPRGITFFKRGAFNKDQAVVKMIIFSLSSNNVKNARKSCLNTLFLSFDSQIIFINGIIMDINRQTVKRISFFSLFKLFTRFSKVGGVVN